MGFSVENLVNTSSAQLERWLHELESSPETTCLTDTPLVALGLDIANKQMLVTTLRWVLAERAQANKSRVELVWTGPDTRAGRCRDTHVALLELFAQARKEVLIAGYRFDHGAEILKPLYLVMRDHGVRTRIFMDVPRIEGQQASDSAAQARDEFMQNNWPFGPPEPEFYYDPRTAAGRVYASLHAKCAVVDAKKAFVSSANFTGRGHERNIEAGVVVDDPVFAEALAGQWLGLLRGGLLVGIGNT